MEGALVTSDNNGGSPSTGKLCETADAAAPNVVRSTCAGYTIPGNATTAVFGPFVHGTADSAAVVANKQACEAAVGASFKSLTCSHADKDLLNTNDKHFCCGFPANYKPEVLIDSGAQYPTATQKYTVTARKANTCDGALAAATDLNAVDAPLFTNGVANIEGDTCLKGINAAGGGSLKVVRCNSTKYEWQQFYDTECAKHAYSSMDDSMDCAGSVTTGSNVHPWSQIFKSSNVYFHGTCAGAVAAGVETEVTADASFTSNTAFTCAAVDTIKKITEDELKKIVESQGAFVLSGEWNHVATGGFATGTCTTSRQLSEASANKRQLTEVTGSLSTTANFFTKDAADVTKLQAATQTGGALTAGALQTAVATACEADATLPTMNVTVATTGASAATEVANAPGGGDPTSGAVMGSVLSFSGVALLLGSMLF